MITEEKRILVASFAHYIKKEGIFGLSDEEKDSVEVALQCLDSVFAVSSISADKILDFNCFLSSISPEAIEEFEKKNGTTAEDKVKAEEFKTQGNKLLVAGKYSEAKGAYLEAISFDPDNAVYYSNLAAAQTALGEYNDAVKSSEKAIEQDPSYAKAWSRLGTALKELGKREESIQAYEEAARLDPTNSQIKKTLTSMKSNKKGGSVPDLTEVINGMDLNRLMSDPNFMAMANQMMQSGAFSDLMKDPSALQEMMKKKK